MVNTGRQTITLAALTLGAAILATPIGPIGPMPAAAAPVTWSFFGTACADLQRGSDCTPPHPFVLATLVLPGPTSAGSAFWQGDRAWRQYILATASPLRSRQRSPAFNP